MPVGGQKASLRMGKHRNPGQLPGPRGLTVDIKGSTGHSGA